jgi:hypothetical protein
VARKPVDNITGRTYLERGRPIVVLVRWGDIKADPEPAVGSIQLLVTTKPYAPKNVLIEREDGTRAVRPFRGLRTVKKEDGDGDA